MLGKTLIAMAILAMSAGSVAAQVAGNAPLQANHAHSTSAELETLRRLRAGGHVIFIRHERTDHTTSDASDFRVDECSGQRNLNAAGVASAEQSGEEIRRLKIPVGEVFASPLCRARETARHMFGKYRLQPRLFSDWRIDKRSAAVQADDFRALVAETIKPNVNTILVGHITGGRAFGRSMHEGEALVFAAGLNGAPVVVGTINAARWGDLVGDDPAK